MNNIIIAWNITIQKDAPELPSGFRLHRVSFNVGHTDLKELKRVDEAIVACQKHVLVYTDREQNLYITAK